MKNLLHAAELMMVPSIHVLLLTRGQVAVAAGFQASFSSATLSSFPEAFPDQAGYVPPASHGPRTPLRGGVPIRCPNQLMTNTAWRVAHQ